MRSRVISFNTFSAPESWPQQEEARHASWLRQRRGFCRARQLLIAHEFQDVALSRSLQVQYGARLRASGRPRWRSDKRLGVGLQQAEIGKLTSEFRRHLDLPRST